MSSLDDMEEIDQKTFIAIGEKIREKGHPNETFNCGDIIKTISEQEDILEEEVRASLEILDEEFLLIDIQYVRGGLQSSDGQMTERGIKVYLNNFVEDYENKAREIDSLIYEEELRSYSEIVDSADMDSAFTIGYLDRLESAGYISVQKGLGHLGTIDEIKEKGKRRFREKLGEDVD